MALASGPLKQSRLYPMTVSSGWFCHDRAASVGVHGNGNHMLLINVYDNK